MGPYGTFLGGLMRLYGALWCCMGPYGSLWGFRVWDLVLALGLRV